MKSSRRNTLGPSSHPITTVVFFVHPQFLAKSWAAIIPAKRIDTTIMTVSKMQTHFHIIFFLPISPFFARYRTFYIYPLFFKYFLCFAVKYKIRKERVLLNGNLSVIKYQVRN